MAHYDNGLLSWEWMPTQACSCPCRHDVHAASIERAAGCRKIWFGLRACRVLCLWQLLPCCSVCTRSNRQAS